MSITNNTEQALIDRGVNRGLAAVLVAKLGTDNVARTIAWFDEQGGRVGAGVLVAELRAGGRPGAGEPASIECPQTPEIEAEWLAALQQLDGNALTIDDDVALSWAQKCHPHAHDAAGWTLGAESWVLGWISKYLPAIRRGLGERVHIVQCGAAAAQSITPAGARAPIAPAGPTRSAAPPQRRAHPTTEGRRP